MNKYIIAFLCIFSAQIVADETESVVYPTSEEVRIEFQKSVDRFNSVKSEFNETLEKEMRAAGVQTTKPVKKNPGVGIHPEKKKMLDKAEYHRYEGRRYYEEADAMCHIIPNWDLKDIAIIAYVSCIDAICSGSPQSVAIHSLLHVLGKYGIDQWRDWDIMRNKLELSKMHYAERDKCILLANKM